MGFSWSSFVAQSQLLSSCARAGLAADVILCDDLPAPFDVSDVFGLATDDVVHFTTCGAARSQERMASLDAALVADGVLRNCDKDVNGSLDGTAVGVDLCDGTFLAPSAPKLLAALAHGADLLARPLVSPAELHSCLGVVQWFDLLNRLLFSALDVVYDFVRDPDDHVPRVLPPAVRSELLVALLLAPLMEADLTRPWLPLLAATDASDAFGFGACVSPVSPVEARRVGRLGEKRGDFVRLRRDGGPTDEAARPRLGTPHTLRLAKSDFRTVLSVRAKEQAHSGLLEATGLVMTVDWLLRSVARRSHRVAVLVDAKTVLCAAVKGRSSSPGLLRILRRLAARVLAGDLFLRLVYVPSEDNPADAPSRGVRGRAPPRLPCAQRGRCRVDGRPLRGDALAAHRLSAALERRRGCLERDHRDWGSSGAPSIASGALADDDD